MRKSELPPRLKAGQIPLLAARLKARPFKSKETHPVFEIPSQGRQHSHANSSSYEPQGAVTNDRRRQSFHVSHRMRLPVDSIPHIIQRNVIY